MLHTIPCKIYWFLAGSDAHTKSHQIFPCLRSSRRQRFMVRLAVHMRCSICAAIATQSAPGPCEVHAAAVGTILAGPELARENYRPYPDTTGDSHRVKRRGWGEGMYVQGQQQQLCVSTVRLPWLKPRSVGSALRVRATEGGMEGLYQVGLYQVGVSWRGCIAIY
jgi:hypothetical protein